MSELGKVDRTFFEQYIYPNLGAPREDVVLGPKHGVDFGVVDIEGAAVAMSTDPVFVMPALGWERAAWFAFHILLSDVAVSGIPPTHLSIDWNLPPEIDDEEFETVWETFDREAREFGVSVVTGHTARYAGCTYPMVGGATAIAVGSHEDLVRPDGATVGDRVLITKGPAIEATALLSIQFEELMAAERPASDVKAAQARFEDMSPIADALTAAAAGPVTAMHDATECGVYGGLHEIAEASGVGLEVDREAIPIQPGVQAAAEFFDFEPWAAISEGTLLVTVDPAGVEPVLEALAAEDIPAAEIGQVTEGPGVVVDETPIDHPGTDPFWATFDTFMRRLQAETGEEG